MTLIRQGSMTILTTSSGEAKIVSGGRGRKARFPVGMKLTLLEARELTVGQRMRLRKAGVDVPKLSTNGYSQLGEHSGITPSASKNHIWVSEEVNYWTRARIATQALEKLLDEFHPNLRTLPAHIRITH